MRLRTLKTNKRIKLCSLGATFLLAMTSTEVTAQAKPKESSRPRPLAELFGLKAPNLREKSKESQPNLLKGLFAASEKANSSTSFQKVAQTLEAQETYYCMGGSGPTHWDCSHATIEIINRVRKAHGESPIAYRTSHSFRSHLNRLDLQIDCEDAQKGDLIVWHYGHVGLIYDDKLFISSHGSGGISFKSYVDGFFAQRTKSCFENPWI